MKSARTERAPIQSPPKAAAVGMQRLSSWTMLVSLCPLITICWSFSCLATYKHMNNTAVTKAKKLSNSTSTCILTSGVRKKEKRVPHCTTSVLKYKVHLYMFRITLWHVAVQKYATRPLYLENGVSAVRCSLLIMYSCLHLSQMILTHRSRSQRRRHKS